MLAVLVVAVAPAAVALVTGAAAWESWRLTNPSDYQHPLPSGFRYAETPLAEAGLAYEESEIRIKDGTWIRGWLVPAADSSKRLAVVFLHGRAGDRRNVLPLLSMLHQAGAAVAAYDLRENGLSDGSGAGTGLAMREAEDARKAVEALHRSGYERIVLMGCSLGASAAILASAENRHVAGVVSDSGLASVHGFVTDTALRRLAKLGLARPTIADGFARLVMWIARRRLGLSSIEDPIARIWTERPILIIHGKQDLAVPPQHAVDLAARAGSAAEIWLVEGAGHCNGHAFDPEGYRARLSSFLGAILRGPVSTRE